MGKRSIFWFRRDLRLHDNIGLFQALSSSDEVIPVYVYDPEDWGHNGFDDYRVSFIQHEIEGINQSLSEYGARVSTFVGSAEQLIIQLATDHEADAVYVNQEFEPRKIHRDSIISNGLKNKGISWFGYTDHLILHPSEVLKDDGSPYQVFTPYSKRWRIMLSEKGDRSVDNSNLLGKLVDSGLNPKISTELNCPAYQADRYPDRKTKPSLLRSYAETRDQVHLENGTSGLGIHLRYGTVSPRLKFKRSNEYSEVFTTELIWREFFASILFHYPRVVTESFRPEYDNIIWRNDDKEIDKWMNGMTGYPIVDAGMNQLNQTGNMHNRVRMIVASFLVKNLLVDWRIGEAYFSEKLLDYDLASNNGNWQWAAGTGVDAAPYFRVFNPESQQKRYDPNMDYIKRWLPYDLHKSPKPMVDLKSSRLRCLETYKKTLNR